MAEPVAAVLGWLVPAVTVLGISGIAVLVTVWAVHRAARGPKARAVAEERRSQAGAKLVALDDAVAELDLEVGLSGALHGGDAPPSLRRARMTAQHARDALFEEYRGLLDAALPRDIAHRADRISARADQSLRGVATARSEHAEWMRAHVSAAEQVSAARRRLDALRASMGDPSALVAELSARFDPEEWADASRASSTAIAQADEAARLLDLAAAQAQEPSTSAQTTLAEAARAQRSAEAAARALEESHRLVTQAAAAVSNELDLARTAIRQAIITRDALDPRDGERLGTAVAAAEGALDEAAATAPRRPTGTVDALARLHHRLDLALGDARTAQQRLRAARSALPGTLAAA
ncbi:MAG: hypothetical protein QM602_08295, partial [Microbacterium sp.]